MISLVFLNVSLATRSLIVEVTLSSLTTVNLPTRSIYIRAINYHGKTSHTEKFTMVNCLFDVTSLTQISIHSMQFPGQSSVIGHFTLGHEKN